MVSATWSAVLAILLSGSATGPHPLVGSWKVDFPAGMRVENGVPTPIRLTGTLTVESQGDSLIATLVADPNDQPPRPPLRLATKPTSGDVIFVTRSQATLNINGAEQKATSVATWTLVAKGDKLEGTVDRKLEGFDAPSAGPQPLTGTRVKP